MEQGNTDSFVDEEESTPPAALPVTLAGTTSQCSVVAIGTVEPAGGTKATQVHPLHP